MNEGASSGIFLQRQTSTWGLDNAYCSRAAFRVTSIPCIRVLQELNDFGGGPANEHLQINRLSLRNSWWKFNSSGRVPNNFRGSYNGIYISDLIKKNCNITLFRSKTMFFNITLFKSKTMSCGTDSMLWIISHIQPE